MHSLVLGSPTVHAARPTPTITAVQPATLLELEEQRKVRAGEDLAARPLYLQAVADYKASRGEAVYPDAARDRGRRGHQGRHPPRDDADADAAGPPRPRRPRVGGAQDADPAARPARRHQLLQGEDRPRGHTRRHPLRDRSAARGRQPVQPRRHAPRGRPCAQAGDAGADRAGVAARRHGARRHRDAALDGEPGPLAASRKARESCAGDVARPEVRPAWVPAHGRGPGRRGGSCPQTGRCSL